MSELFIILQCDQNRETNNWKNLIDFNNETDRFRNIYEYAIVFISDIKSIYGSLEDKIRDTQAHAKLTADSSRRPSPRVTSVFLSGRVSVYLIEKRVIRNFPREMLACLLDR